MPDRPRDQTPVAARPDPRSVRTVWHWPAGGTPRWVSPDVFVLELDPDPDGPRRARGFLRGVLSQCGQQQLARTADVLISELVTNAVVHARSPVHLKVAVREVAVRVEVTDASALPPRLEPPRADATAGRGLQLVDALADEWAYEVVPGDGKTVWFQINTA